MDRARCLQSVDTDGHRILSFFDSPGVSSSAPVPTCPDWTLDDLAIHLGRIYSWVGAILDYDPAGPPDRDQIPQYSEGQPPADWMRTGLDRVLRLLGDIPVGATRWNFVTGPDSPVAFWWRRQMHETLIHRVDAELAAGAEVDAAAPEVAADGISELLELNRYVRVDEQDLRLGEGLTIHLHATDVEPDAEWTIDTVNRNYAAAHLKADVALRGPAWALDRWSWRRGDLSPDSGLFLGGEVTTFGDWEVAEGARPSI
ncbi:MAG: maleylpyruvate isomerase N-terminal domain-containing protein [Acidimicrobiales bacterium]